MLARGSYQRDIYDLFSAGWKVTPPERHLHGRARSYLTRYRYSFFHLIARMMAAGEVVTRTPGPRGGEWGATYQLAPLPRIPEHAAELAGATTAPAYRP